MYGPPGVGVDVLVVVGLELAVFAVELEQPAAIAAATTSATDHDADKFRQPGLPSQLRETIAGSRARQCARRQNAPSQSIDSIGSSIPCASR